MSDSDKIFPIDLLPYRIRKETDKKRYDKEALIGIDPHYSSVPYSLLLIVSFFDIFTVISPAR